MLQYCLRTCLLYPSNIGVESQAFLDPSLIEQFELQPRSTMFAGLAGSPLGCGICSVVGSFVASCCGSMVARGCGTAARTSARFAYCFLFLMSMLLAWIMRDFAAPLLQKIPCECRVADTRSETCFFLLPPPLTTDRLDRASF